MTPTSLLIALKRRFRTPADALRHIGLDPALLDPDERPVIIAHDWEPPSTTQRGRSNMNNAEFRLLDAMRTKFRTMGEPMRLLGLDEADLEAAGGGEPDGGDVDALLQQFSALSDA